MSETPKYNHAINHVGINVPDLRVKSPAPPVVALVGLFGMLGGEQAVRWFHDWRSSTPSAHVASAAETFPPQTPKKQP